MKSKNSEHRISINSKLPNNFKNEEYNSIMKWASNISQHPYLYCPVNQMITNYHYYKIQFLQVSDIEVLLGKRKQYLQITCIIYNKRTQSFIGSTYSSEIFDIEPKRQEKAICYCKKSIYFYTELDDIVLKVDIWRLQSDKNGKGIQNMTKRIYIGGFQINLGQSMQSGFVQKTLNNTQERRFQYQRDGQSIQTQQSEQNLKRKPSKILISAINTHSLSHLHHFIAPNYIYDSHSIILGLKDNKISQDGKILMGERNRLNFQIKSVMIPINIGKKIAEISQQKIKSNFEINGRVNINIKEVRLNFEFHNGWKSVSNESLILKQFNHQSTAIEINRTAPSKISIKNSKSKEPIQMNKTYGYEKPKQLKAVFIGEGGILMLWLQAKIQCKFDLIDSGNSKKTKNQIFYLPIAFALKTIKLLQQQTTISLQLFQGNVYSLSNLITYFSQLKSKKNIQQKKDQNNEKINCNLSFFLKKTGGTIENIQTVEKDMNEIQLLKIEKQRLARLKRKIKQQKRKKMIQLNQQIPFLDTIQLKQQLYEEKITRLKNQKLQQQEILFFLKNKMNQLQRQTLKNQLNFHENQGNDDEVDGVLTKGIKIKKLPNNFMDYRPNKPETVHINKAILIKKFDASYCKMAMEPSKQVSPHLIQSCIHSDIYIQFKITLLQIFYEEINTVKLLIPNFEGSYQKLSFSKNQFENKSIEIKVNYLNQKTQFILSQLLNGYFTIFLQIQSNILLKANAILSISELIEKCNSGDLLQYIEKSVLFEQGNTLIGLINFTISFTNISNIVKLTNTQKKVKRLQNQGGIFSILNRINRLKQEKGLDNKKRQLVSNVISNFNINKVNLIYKQLNIEQIKLIFKNSTCVRQKYALHIFDEDSKYLQDEQIKIVKINEFASNSIISIAKNKDFQIQSGHSCQITLIYQSNRMNINFTHFEHLQDYIINQSFYKVYNRCHKISINITEKQTNVIVTRYQINIIPQYQFNQHPIQRFLAQSETFSFPIITSNLKLATSKNDISQYPQKIELATPSLANSDLYVSQFQLSKSLPHDNSVTFQNFVFYGWGCERIDIEGRLWQKKDVLIKIPLEAIIQAQIKLSYQIDSIIAMSRHVSLKIRQAGDFKYTSILNINRINAEIILRAQLMVEAIGKCTYGIQIADKNMKVFHRIGVCMNVQYPSLAAHQIVTIKVPSDRLKDPEPFSFVNRQQTGLQFQLKCFKPHLLRFGQAKGFLKVEQKWKIEMYFNWNSIINEMLQQDKDQNSILIGIKSRLSIEYLLFKIKIK